MIAGLRFGWNWTGSSRMEALVASYHPPTSVTWRWAVYWTRARAVGERRGFRLPRWWRYPDGSRGARLSIPLVGSISVHTQPRLERAYRGGAA